MKRIKNSLLLILLFRLKSCSIFKVSKTQDGIKVQTGILERIKSVQERISDACLRSRRDPESVQILAVSKTKPAEMVVEAFQAGLRDFGENRFQETPGKIQQVAKLLAEQNSQLRWHFIGHLQSNKVRKVLEYFTRIQSLDSEKLIQQVDRIAGEMGLRVEGMLQVNVSGSPTQFGFAPHQISSVLEKTASCKHLFITGLMAIGPNTTNEYLIRRAFERIRLEAERIDRQTIPNVKIAALSMGMSGDFEIAIEEGATMVRLGTVIFGERN